MLKKCVKYQHQYKSKQTRCISIIKNILSIKNTKRINIQNVTKTINKKESNKKLLTLLIKKSYSHGENYKFYPQLFNRY